MSPDQPFLSVILFFGSLYLLHLWNKDRQAALTGKPNPGALPGATNAAPALIMVGIVGALILTMLETLGEYGLGIVEEQSELRFWFIFAGLGAAVIEEIIFRGYLVVQNKGRAALIGSIIGFSILFAVLHPFIWVWDDEGFRFDFSQKALFTTFFLFISSVFFYALRFNPWNKNRSLLPCFIAHAVGNVAVFFVKAWQGFIIWS